MFQAVASGGIHQGEEEQVLHPGRGEDEREGDEHPENDRGAREPRER